MGNITRPDVTPRVLLRITPLWPSGWAPTIGLEDGIRSTYAWFCEHVANGMAVR